MIKRYHYASFLFAVPGWVLATFGAAVSWMPGPHTRPGWYAVVAVGATALILIGLAFGARAKGRAIWWALPGIIPIAGFWIGAIVLSALKDRTAPTPRPIRPAR